MPRILTSGETKETMWRYGKYVVRYSEPSVQATDSCKKISSFGDILCFSYTMEIMREIDDGYELISRVFVSENGHALEFRDMLKQAISDDPISDGQPYTVLADGSKLYGRSRSVLDNVTDCYEVTKYRNDTTKEDRYAVYIGGMEDDAIASCSTGVRFQNLCEKDIKELYNAILGFVQTAVSDYNMSLEKNLAAKAHNKLIRDGKIYEYAVENGNIDFGRLSAIYIPGDGVTIRAIQKGVSSVDTTTIQTLSSDTVTDISGKKYKIYDIVDLYPEVPEDKRTGDIAAIMMDFVNILSAEEKEEMLDKELDILYNKYHEAIANRTLVYEEEHRLPNLLPGGGNDLHANGDVVVRMIIEMVCITLKAAKKKSTTAKSSTTA